MGREAGYSAVARCVRPAKRLFGLRGGAAADEAEGARDQGWEALERTAPPTPSLN